MPPVQTSSSSVAGSSYCSGMAFFFILDSSREPTVSWLITWVSVCAPCLNCSNNCFCVRRFNDTLWSCLQWRTHLEYWPLWGAHDGPQILTFSHFLRRFSILCTPPLLEEQNRSHCGWCLLGSFLAYRILWLESVGAGKNRGGKRKRYQWAGPCSWWEWWGWDHRKGTGFQEGFGTSKE